MSMLMKLDSWEGGIVLISPARGRNLPRRWRGCHDRERVASRHAFGDLIVAERYGPGHTYGQLVITERSAGTTLALFRGYSPLHRHRRLHARSILSLMGSDIVEVRNPKAPLWLGRLLRQVRRRLRPPPSARYHGVKGTGGTCRAMTMFHQPASRSEMR